MKCILSATNALNKWLKADLPRLPVELGKQPGVGKLSTNANTLSWQVHIIDNANASPYKTIIACEAYSRFTFFLPVRKPLSLQELTQLLLEEWQVVLAHTLEEYRMLPRLDLVFLIGRLFDIKFDTKWIKNTDLSINGHTVDAGLWITDTLRDRNMHELTPDLAMDIAIYLNTQTRRLKQRKEKFVPVERLLAYCQSIADDSSQPYDFKRKEAKADKVISYPANVVQLSDYRK